MYHSQVNEYKYEILRLNRDLQDLKKKYYDQKKRDREEKLFHKLLKLEQQQLTKEGSRFKYNNNIKKISLNPAQIPPQPQYLQEFLKEKQNESPKSSQKKADNPNEPPLPSLV